MVKAIFIDAGHGLGPTGSVDNGASGNGTTEREHTVAMTNALVLQLQNDPSFAGVKIFKVAADERLRLVDHIKVINDACKTNGWFATDTLMLSIHINSGEAAARGLEAWYSPSEARMLDFAKLCVSQVSQTTGIPARAKPALITAENRFGRLGIIDDTIAQGVLFEAGFITNAQDVQFLLNPQLRMKIVEGLHNAIRIFLGLGAMMPSTPSTPSIPVTPTPTPTPVPSTPPAFYTDVPVGAWYHDDVALCFGEGLFRMPADGQFHPERPVTRAELAAVMARHLRKRHNVS